MGDDRILDLARELVAEQCLPETVPPPASKVMLQQIAIGQVRYRGRTIAQLHDELDSLRSEIAKAWGVLEPFDAYSSLAETITMALHKAGEKSHEGN